MQPMPPPPPAPPVPGQNKMSPLAWVAIGCGVIVVVCLIAMAGLAFMGGRFLKKHVDKNGNISVTTKEGTATFDASGTKDGGGAVKITNEKGEQITYSAGAGAPKNLPSWVPVYPGATVQGSYDANTAEARSAAFTVTAPGSVDTLAEYYEAQLKSAGLTIQKNTYEAGGQKTTMLVGKSSDDKRTATVTISTSEGKSQALINFVEKK